VRLVNYYSNTKQRSIRNTNPNYKFGAKPNVSPPGAVSPIGEKFKGAEISPGAKSHGPKSNALAYAERALST